MPKYNLEQFKTIQFSNFTYVLPEIVLTIVANLSKELGVLNTPQPSASYAGKNSSEYGFSENNGKYRKNRNPPVLKTWEKVKPFKMTVIDKKEGIEKRINDIRICLNKISNKNYDSQKDSIIQYIEELRNDVEEDEELLQSSQQKVATAIYDIASNNKFYSVLYAVLYKELIDKFSIFKDILSGFIDIYLTSMKSIEYVDPNTDYDKYCLNNKENDKRKAMSVFIVNLMKNDILEKNKVLDIIKQLQEMVLKYIDTPNKLNEVEEITENIFLFVTTAKDDFTLENESWKAILDTVRTCSQMKYKEHTSLSSRAVFKYMDILEKV